LICDEIGNVFDNLKDPLNSGPLVIWRSSGQRCPTCNRALLADFQLSTESDLVALGLGSADFEVAPQGIAESVLQFITC